MKYILIITIISLSFINEIAYSQPTATVQFMGGYSIPIGDYSGKFGDTKATFTGNGNPDSNSYFMRPGFGYGIFVKVPLGKKSPVSIKGGVVFNNFSQKKEYTEGGGSVTVALKQNVLNLSIGSEYDFGGRKSKVRPFAGVEISGNFFSGNYSEDYIDSVEAFDMNAAFRLGANVLAGVDIALHNNIGVFAGVKYSFMNIIGKNYEADTRTRYGLNDAEHTIDNINYPSRNITTLQIFGGLSFYFGK